ncbi:hypothetical protein C471_08475 [Halorubrum saccharovorum DSM 1137]|uniref:Uncharacterized protein n=1 Tax=Halorubrum saccharovorum DSM 1137 TaxID=1227484 RepID=M0DZ11_9EURY|nr:hypothetical protein [Halorubrum saccharovorum]ELZ39339.1 hypothetical protein C471_08475 [Halorubrum saccharovorum DSM 1137]
MTDSDSAENETVKACPYCDSASVVTNSAGGGRTYNPDADQYRCADCQRTFNEPNERESGDSPGIRPDSIAAKLDAADPDDLVTDGGVERIAGLRDAYDQLEHEVIACSPSLSVPTATPARFAYADPPGVTDADAIADRLADSPIAFLDVLATNGESWYDFHVSSAAYDDEHDGDCKVTITTAGVTVVRTHRDLPPEAFEHVVEAIADAVDAPLRFDADT